MTITFGETTVCTPCRGKGVIRDMTCAGCDGSGLFTRRPVARATDPDTSWAAARSVSGLRESQRVILALLRQYGPMTDEQLWERHELIDGRLPLSPSGARTRRAELVDAGYVRDSGKRRRLSSGRMAIVWEAVP